MQLQRILVNPFKELQLCHRQEAMPPPQKNNLGKICSIDIFLVFFMF